MVKITAIPQELPIQKKILKPFQEDYILSPAKYPAFLSAWGTGKTMSAIARVWLLAKNYPNNLIIIFRLEFVNLKDSTMRDFQLYTGIDMKLQQTLPRKDIVLPNGSQISFRHADDLASLQNINLGAFFLEQAEEITSDEIWFTLLGRLRRQGCFRTGFLTANACGHNWVWKLWKDNPPSKDYALHGDDITTFDNADNLPADYIQFCHNLEKDKPSHHRRFVMNSSDEEDVFDFIMDRSVVEKARDTKVYGTNKRLISFDPSRLKDEFVIYFFEGARVVDYKFINPRNYPAGIAMVGAGEVVLLANQYAAGMVTGDVIGLGGPVIERVAELLKDKKIQIKEVNSALPPESEENQSRYLNLRAEMWFYTWEQIEQGKVQIPNDPELINQLCSVKFRFVKGKYRVEEKEEIKKRLGKSPDRADSFVQGIWSLQFCKRSRSYNRETPQFHFESRRGY